MPAKATTRPTPSLKKPPSAAQLERKKSQQARIKPDPETAAYEATSDPSGRYKWSDGTEVRRLVMYVPPELALRFRAVCASREQKLSAVGTEMLAQWLATSQQ